MLGRLFILFTLVPAIELFLLIEIGQRLGGLTTLGLVLLTGALGAALAKAEGLRVLREWRSSLAEGRVPADSVASGALVLVGGVLLITPGVLTDVVGLSLLVPALRRPIAGYLLRRVETAIARGTLHVVHTHPASARPEAHTPWPRDVIDVEGESVSSSHAELPRAPDRRH
jgi:UPF0716 protein FxsA